MTLQELIAGRLKTESKEQGSITNRVISFEGTICHFESAVSFGPDKSTPVYRHIYRADLREFDPKNIEYRRTSSGPALVLWTRFIRNAVEYETWRRSQGRVGSKMTDSLFIPVEKAFSPAEKRDLKHLAESIMSGVCVTDSFSEDLEATLDELSESISNLTNGLDFSSHGGQGVLEQEIRLSSDRTALVFQQFRKAKRESDGTRLDACIPLWTIMEDLYSCHERERSGEGLPRVGFSARDPRKPFEFQFSGPPPFVHKNTREDIYCQTGDDCDALKARLEEAIGLAKDLAYKRHSEQVAAEQPATAGESK